jgi:hypothetical protein
LAAATSRPVLPEDEEALERLNKLEHEGWVQAGDFKRHYFGVSEALKRYVERRYGFDAAEQTTREMLRGLEGAGVAPASVAQIARLFELLDRVKFTDYRPEVGSAEPGEVLGSARTWVKQTRRPSVSQAPVRGGANAP